MRALLLLLPALLLACGEGDHGNTAASSSGAGASGSASGGGGPGSGASGTGGNGGVPPEPVPGLRAEYFSTYLDLVVERVEPTLDVVWGAAEPVAGVGADRFSARWLGTLRAPAAGTYQLITENDDGVRVWVDDVLVIDDWVGHFVQRSEATVELPAGEVPLRIEYFEIDLDAQLRLLWSGAELPEAPIPESALQTIDVPSGLPGPKPPYQNPVMLGCADPGVIAVAEGGETVFRAACTGGAFPIQGSRSLVFWQDTGAAILPAGKPDWAANGGRNWAPEIHQVGSELVAYFTSVNGGNVLSIGAAHAPDAAGPWVDIGGPLVEHPQGVIDATFFEDADGSRWLVYKIDGNSVGAPTPIYARRLADDGLSFAPASDQVELIRNDGGTWEGGVVEAPWILLRDGQYFLIYSGNVYDHRYRTGVARAPSLLGPYEKHGAPILGNNERWVGPGHGSVVVVGGVDWFVYHAWSNNGAGQHLESAGRQMLIDRIDWVDGWPIIHDGTPSRSAQPWPGTTPP
jgi:GH43 family beta-xylosidase